MNPQVYDETEYYQTYNNLMIFLKDEKSLFVVGTVTQRKVTYITLRPPSKNKSIIFQGVLNFYLGNFHTKELLTANSIKGGDDPSVDFPKFVIRLHEEDDKKHLELLQLIDKVVCRTLRNILKERKNIIKNVADELYGKVEDFKNYCSKEFISQLNKKIPKGKEYLKIIAVWRICTLNDAINGTDEKMIKSILFKYDVDILKGLNQSNKEIDEEYFKKVWGVRCSIKRSTYMTKDDRMIHHGGKVKIYQGNKIKNSNGTFKSIFEVNAKPVGEAAKYNEKQVEKWKMVVGTNDVFLKILAKKSFRAAFALRRLKFRYAGMDSQWIFEEISARATEIISGKDTLIKKPKNNETEKMVVAAKSEQELCKMFEDDDENVPEESVYNFANNDANYDGFNGSPQEESFLGKRKRPIKQEEEQENDCNRRFKVPKI